MNTLFKQLSLLLPALCIAGIAGAYTPPTTTAPGDNTDGPITIGATNDAKNGSLNVGTFQARGNALLAQDVYVSGLINGGHPSDTTSTVTIGSAATPMKTIVSGTISAANGQSGTLSHSGTGTKNVCAAPDGTYILCGATPTDVCPNIAGAQASIPAGMVINGAGNCIVEDQPIDPGVGGAGTGGTFATCFVADTRVTLSDGSKKNIQDVQIGDVLRGETSNNTVLAFHRPKLNGMIYSFNGGRYFVTEEHPFMTTEGWKSINPEKTALENIGIEVTSLEVGDTLITDHGLVLLTTIHGKAESSDTDLYNFMLSGDRTYFADGYLVHNKAQCSGSTSCGPNQYCINNAGAVITSGGGSCSLVCTPGGNVPTTGCQSPKTPYCASDNTVRCH